MTKYQRQLIHHPTIWLDHVIKQRGLEGISPIETALQFYSDEMKPTLEKGLAIANILFSIGLDNETLAAALIYPLIQTQEIHSDLVVERLGEGINQLLQDALQMQSFAKLKNLDHHGHQIENLRKMLLSMITDIRAVLMILAERIWQLHGIKSADIKEQKRLAQESFDLYAPLANRLGVWQLKWEIEDLCLRYLQPDIYHEIAKGLASRRDEREAYVQQAIQLLTEVLQKSSIKEFKISGRVKHIYSIYKKMQRKHANLQEIYDMSALRVLVKTVDDCYHVLSVLHDHWDQFQEEFDDYIANPKENGYRSIHTVIIGPKHHFIEIQIRTEVMHHESELGVAAHWRYKEGILQPSSYEAKIALLRQIMAWQKEIAVQPVDKTVKPLQDLFADRIYVFTPTGDIIDLQQGATPLDFAYHIHSEVGHRCRGAKINGNIVPLTYALQTGDRVEILTTKQANPSRDWLNPHLNYIKTSRARAKIQHWFRMKDSIQSVATEHVQPQPQPPQDPPISLVTHSHSNIQKLSTNVQIVGIDHVLNHMALCCKPLPGDAIIGYVTKNRGVTVHRRDCSNVSHITKNHQERLMEVNWGSSSAAYPADLILRVYDRAGLLRDLTTILASEKINVLGLQTQKNNDSDEVDIYLTIETIDREHLNKALQLLHHIPNILEVRRR